MPSLTHGDAEIHYTDGGDPDGFPVLAIAPGGMRSATALWTDMPWNPHVRLADQYRVIGMDQRNAGASTAPVTAADGWDTYTADQMALVDHLGLDRFAVIGMCIGGPYVMGIVKAAGDRVAAAVMLQPIGLDGNRQAFYDMFDAWADTLRDRQPDVDDSAWAEFRERMYGGEFLFNTARDEVEACSTPLLVAMGNDLYHPASVSREIVALAPNATLIEVWKDAEHVGAADETIRSFLAENARR